MKNNDISKLTAEEILVLFQKKELSPVAVMQATIDNIKKYNYKLNAFSLLFPEDILLRQAKESEQRWYNNMPLGFLDGIPTTIKDGYDIKSYPTRHGSLLSSAEPAIEDSPAVKLLRDAGAIFIGKTTMPEYGTRGVTESPLTGITRNPHDITKTSGGSSGGAAVAAATSMGVLHLAGDAGGSIRIPASFCGVFGLKPSYGLVPRQEVSLLSHFAATGPITKFVKDAEIMMQVIAPNFSSYRGKIEDLKIAFAPTINGIAVQQDVKKSVYNACMLLRNIVELEEIELNIPNLVGTFNNHWIVAAKLHLSETKKEDIEKLDKYLVEWGEKEIDIVQYAKSEVNRKLIKQQMQNLLEKYDVLVLPTMAVTAFDTGCNSPILKDGSEWQDWTPFTFPANLSGLPAASIPCGIDKNKMPIGLQIIAGRNKDGLVLKIADFLETKLKN